MVVCSTIRYNGENHRYITGGDAMRRFNLARPILLLAVAFFVNSLSSFLIVLLFKTSQETASNIAFFIMLIAVILVYRRMMTRKPRS